MDNAKIREMALAAAAEKAESKSNASQGLSAEERARRKAEKQASYERRMAIEKRRKEALAEASRYTDRAAARRKEEMKIAKETGVHDDGRLLDAETEEPDPDHVSNKPTFAQLGDREDLSQQQHRLSIAQSKYLGGDIEHTHLVKGLDFALLQKTRAELEAPKAKAGGSGATSAAAKQPAASVAATAEQAAAGAANRAARRMQQQAVQTAAAPTKPKAISSERPEDVAAIAFQTVEGRELHRAIFGGRSKRTPNAALAEGRLVLVYDLSPTSTIDVPSTLVRARDDLSAPRQPKDTHFVSGLPESLLARMSKLWTGSKKKKAKASASTEPLDLWAPTPIAMKPLRLVAAPDAPASATSFVSSAPDAMYGVAAAPRWGGAPADSVGGGASSAARSSAGSAGASGVKFALKAPGKAAKAAPAVEPIKGPVEGDVDDIFGDGVGSNYVCELSEAQKAKAAREAEDARVVRSVTAFQRSEQEEVAAAEAAAEQEAAVAPALMMDEDEGGAEGEASALLATAMAPRAREEAPSKRAGGASPMAVVDDDEEADDAALLAASKGRAAGGEAPVSRAGKDMAMVGAMDNSYDEFFPSTYEGFSHSLTAGPDSDEETGIVRNEKKGGEEDGGDGAAGGKKGGKRRGHDVEAIKQKAKEDRELAQIEKLMEERREKRQRRDGDGDGGGPGGAGGVDQNELF